MKNYYFRFNTTSMHMSAGESDVPDKNMTRQTSLIIEDWIQRNDWHKKNGRGHIPDMENIPIHHENIKVTGSKAPYLVQSRVYHRAYETLRLAQRYLDRTLGVIFLYKNNILMHTRNNGRTVVSKNQHSEGLLLADLLIPGKSRYRRDFENAIHNHIEDGEFDVLVYDPKGSMPRTPDEKATYASDVEPDDHLICFFKEYIEELEWVLDGYRQSEKNEKARANDMALPKKQKAWLKDLIFFRRKLKQ